MCTDLRGRGGSLAALGVAALAPRRSAPRRRREEPGCGRKLGRSRGAPRSRRASRGPRPRRESRPRPRLRGPVGDPPLPCARWSGCPGRPRAVTVSVTTTRPTGCPAAEAGRGEVARALLPDHTRSSCARSPEGCAGLEDGATSRSAPPALGQWSQPLRGCVIAPLPLLWIFPPTNHQPP